MKIGMGENFFRNGRKTDLRNAKPEIVMKSFVDSADKTVLLCPRSDPVELLN